jgi:hypothetical protein
MFKWSGNLPYIVCWVCLGCGGVFNVVAENLIAIAFAGREWMKSVVPVKSHQWLAGLVNLLATLWKEYCW